jgi:membrane protein DedA with SNARE-associated domain
MYDEILALISVFALAEIGVVAVLLLSGFGAPIPEDIPLLLAGFFCSEAGGRLSHLSMMLPLTYAAVLGADLIVYGLGRRYGRHVVELPFLRRLLTTARLEIAEQTFHEHGGKTLAIARFLPGLRSAVFITAGIFRIPLWKMVAYDGGAALISVPLWVFFGYFFGEHIPQILHYAGQVRLWLLLAGCGAATLVACRYFWLRQRLRPGDTAASGIAVAPVPAMAVAPASPRSPTPQERGL